MFQRYNIEPTFQKFTNHLDFQTHSRVKIFKIVFMDSLRTLFLNIVSHVPKLRYINFSKIGTIISCFLIKHL